MNNIAIPAAEWAAKITASWRESVGAILNVGKLLSESKDALGLKSWEKMCNDDLPFSSGTAYRLIAISTDPRILAHVPKLPPHWGTMHELTKLTDEQFDDMLSDGTINPEMDRRDVTGRLKAEKRDAKERDLGAKQVDLPEAKFGVILADPEWKFDVWSEKGKDRSADNHYPTSETFVIANRDVPSIAADDCVLFLWATVPMLPQALQVMEGWGFQYKSHIVWEKDRIGTGYWFRNAHELLLVGTKGNIPAPAPGTQRPSVIEGRVTKHSAKPEVFHELIEQYFPTLPKIELNRRGPARKGWAAWGNETENGCTASAPQPSESADHGLISATESADSLSPTADGGEPPEDLDLPAFLQRGNPDCTWDGPQ